LAIHEKRYKNKTFEDIHKLKLWLWNMVCAMDKDLIKWIVANKKCKQIICKKLL